MFTASHNPAAYNGIKFSRAGAQGISLDAGLAAIRDRATAYLDSGIPVVDNPGSSTTHDVLAEYAEYLRTLVDLTSIRPLRVVVDAGNGMGGLTVPAVLGTGAGLSPLPIEIIPLYFELDGTFPNHEANPIDPENLKDLQKAVKKHKADIGLAFDGDADRCFLVDEKGDLVNPSSLTSLIASRELAKNPGATIIYNLISSKAVREVVEENGGTSVRSRVGHSYIKKLMAETGAVFGGEHSGHFYFRDFWRADSGALAALHAIAALGETESSLSELLKPFNRYISSGEINSTVADAAAASAQIESIYGGRDGVSLDHLDGLTVEGDTWWFNLRASNTEPLLRLNVEAATSAQMKAVRDDVLNTIRRSA
jgi:phosphomannomutase